MSSLRPSSGVGNDAQPDLHELHERAKALRGQIEQAREAEQPAIADPEQELARLRAEVRRLGDQLRLTRRLATVGTLAGLAAHEFNNILTPIINYAQLAQMNPSMVEKALMHAREGGNQATRICNAILGLWRHGGDRVCRVSIEDVVDDALAAIARDFEKDKIELSLDVQDGLKIQSRRINLQLAVLNVLLNARTAVLGTGRIRQIEIRAVLRQKDLLLSIRDNGIGMTDQERNLAFEPFFCGDAFRDERRIGQGLGLTCCREAVEELGGQVKIESRPNEGTLVEIQIPVEHF